MDVQSTGTYTSHIVSRPREVTQISARKQITKNDLETRGDLDASLSWDPLNYNSCIECALSGRGMQSVRFCHCPRRFQADQNGSDELNPQMLYFARSLSSLRSPTIHVQQAQAIFLSTCFPRENFSHPELSTFPYIVLQMSTDEIPISKALEAAYIIQAGHYHEDEYVIMLGNQAYLRALQHLYCYISDSCHLPEMEDVVLATAHILCFCHTFKFVERNSTLEDLYRNLFAGQLRLDKPQKSKFTQIQATHSWSTALTYGLIWRKPLIRNRGGYRSLPSRASKTLDKMIDIMLQIPSLLQSTDQVLRCSNVPAVAVVRLMDNLTDTAKNLRAWALNLETGSTGPLYYEVQAGPEHRWAFPSRYEFPILVMALLYSRYNTCLLEIYRAVKSLEAVLPLSYIDASNGGPCRPTVDSITSVADAVCMTIIHVCSPEYGHVGYNSVDISLWLVYHWYKEHSIERKLEWCRMMAAKISERGFRTPNLDFDPTANDIELLKHAPCFVRSCVSSGR